MREKENYRDNLAVLKEATHGRLMISLREASMILGVDTKTLKGCQEILDMQVDVGKQRRIPIASLARWMS